MQPECQRAPHLICFLQGVPQILALIICHRPVYQLQRPGRTLEHSDAVLSVDQCDRVDILDVECWVVFFLDLKSGVEHVNQKLVAVENFEEVAFGQAEAWGKPDGLFASFVIEISSYVVLLSLQIRIDGKWTGLLYSRKVSILIRVISGMVSVEI